MQLQFLAPVELFFKQLNGYSFWPGRNYFFYDIQFCRCAVSHVYTFIKTDKIQPFWKVRCLEQYTSWKVRVQNCFFFRKKWAKMSDTDMYMNMHVCICESECDTHGVSVMCLCVCVSLLVYARSKRNESECLDMCTCDRPWSWLLGLERWCMQPENCKVRRNSGGCSWRYWRANHSLCFVLGRKTNRTIRITETEQLYQVKRMIEGIGNVPCSTYSQTLNV